MQLIGATRTTTGLKVHAFLDTNNYEKGHKVTDVEMATVNLQPADLHGNWNYVIKPNDNR